MNDLMLKNNPNNLISLFFYGATDPAFEYRTSENGKADKWLYFRYKFYESPETKDICAIVSIMDISEQKRKEAELIDKAERDQMTGLYNKTTTEKLINEWLHNYESSFGALMMIDIDNFKNVNDKLGHLYGDMMLKKIAEALKAAFRSNDVVGRIGGDEFFVFLKKLYSEKHISDKAKEICKLFHNVFEEKGISCEISASIGVALYPKHGDTLNELYRNADTALYLSKEKGKNNFTIYNGESFRGYALITEIDS
jgi:diguanylate cyclase (GGDEF)-like protein